MIKDELQTSSKHSAFIIFGIVALVLISVVYYFAPTNDNTVKLLNDLVKETNLRITCYPKSDMCPYTIEKKQTATFASVNSMEIAIGPWHSRKFYYIDLPRSGNFNVKLSTLAAGIVPKKFKMHCTRFNKLSEVINVPCGDESKPSES